MVPNASERATFPTPAAVRSLADAELARRIAESAPFDAAAEAELCRRFGPRVRLYGIRHLRDEERVRDLVQSVLLAVLETIRRGRLEDPERLDRFVLGTARNLALKTHRVENRAKPTDTAELDGVPAVPDAERLETGALWRCFSRLESRARAVLHLSFAREKRAEDIAQALDMTAGNVRVVRHRAIAQLRTCLDAKEVSP